VKGRKVSRSIRLGISFAGQCPVAHLLVEARRAEQIGFDVVSLVDHLGCTAPLPPLVAIAAAAPAVRVGNLVINASFYRPALLTRDLASVDSATGGRLEIGLGAGHVEEEFVAAGLPFPKPGARLKLLAQHITEIRASLSDRTFIPPPIQTPPPILVAGMGDKLLAIAAEHADIVAIASLGGEAELAERVDYVKRQAGRRLDQIELAFSFMQVSIDHPHDLSTLQLIAPDAAETDMRQMTTLLDGSVSAAADRIRRLHADLGISYFTLYKSTATTWRTLEQLVEAVR
jgi:probable F420-dependent oxidoreductase